MPACPLGDYAQPPLLLLTPLDKQRTHLCCRITALTLAASLANDASIGLASCPQLTSPTTPPFTYHLSAHRDHSPQPLTASTAWIFPRYTISTRCGLLLWLLRLVSGFPNHSCSTSLENAIQVTALRCHYYDHQCCDNATLIYNLHSTTVTRRKITFSEDPPPSPPEAFFVCLCLNIELSSNYISN